MNRTLPNRQGRRSASTRTVGAAAFALAAALITLAAVPHALRRANAQAGANDLFLPDLRSAGPTTASLPSARTLPVRRRFAPARALGRAGVSGPASISDFGYSAIDLANLSQSALTLKLELSQRGRNAHTLTRQLAAGASGTVRMAEESAISDGVWYGNVRASGAVAAIVRSGWVLSGTSTSAYEGLRPATKLLVPLFVRGVDGVYSDYTLMNIDTALEENVVTFQAFAPDSGELLAEWEDRLGPGDVTNLDAIEIGTAVSDLAANRPDDHWVGGLRIEAAGAVAILIYENEALEGGVSALGARPFAAAATTQYLPLVRRNYLGNSVIAVQNRDGKKATVSIAYRGAPDSPKHANQTVQQTFTIGPNGMHFVDLGTGGIGDVPAPAIDRGGGVNTGFYGSAVVTSDQPVVAAVMETTGRPDRTRTNAAYNAFNGSELGQRFIVPTVQNSAARVTRFIVQNPGAAAATISTKLDLAGGRSTTLGTTVPPGDTRIVTLEAAEQADAARAVITSDQPVAVLVYETPFGKIADYKDADVFDTLAYAAPRDASGAVPSTATATTVGATPSSTPNGTTATATSTPPRATTATVPPTATPTQGTSTAPRWKIDLPIVLRGFRVPGR